MQSGSAGREARTFYVWTWDGLVAEGSIREVHSMNRCVADDIGLVGFGGTRGCSRGNFGCCSMRSFCCFVCGSGVALVGDGNCLDCLFCRHRSSEGLMGQWGEGMIPLLELMQEGLGQCLESDVVPSSELV